MIWAREGSSMPTAVRNACGQASMGPNGVRDQSSERILPPISPPPMTQPAALCAGVLIMAFFSRREALLFTAARQILLSDGSYSDARALRPW
jgi:hypothetical protein